MLHCEGMRILISCVISVVAIVNSFSVCVVVEGNLSHFVVAGIVVVVVCFVVASNFAACSCRLPVDSFDLVSWLIKASPLSYQAAGCRL